MRKKLVIGIIVVVLALLIILFLGFKPFPTKFQFSECDSPEYSEALNKLDVALCEYVPNKRFTPDYYDNYCRELCIYAIASRLEDPQLCELIHDVNDKFNATGEDYSSRKDFCYMHLAQRLDNVSLCDNVETEWARAVCPQLVKTSLPPK